jgi:DNA polymerase III delta subunit
VARSNELFQEISRGLIHPVYILLGEETGAKEEFIHSIIESVFGSKKDEQNLGTTVFYGDSVDAVSIIESANTRSFFSEKQVIVIRDFDKMNNTHLLEDYFNEPNTSSVLILLSNKKSVSKKLSDAAKHRGRVAVFWPMFREEGARWFYRRLKELHIKAEKDAVDYIFEVSGTGMDELNGQLQFLVNWLGEGETLTLERVQNVIARVHSFTVFDLCNAFFVKTSGEILSIYRYLLDYGEDLSKIVYFCAREILKLYTCYAMAEAGNDFAVVKKKMNMRTMEARRVRMIIPQMNRRRFAVLFSKLTKIDFTVKTSPREMGQKSLELFLAGLGTSNTVFRQKAV